MDNATEESIMDIIGKLKKIDYINPEDIPNIDLYMDQVTTFMDEHLAACKRLDDDKILTKTMINNYTKNDFLPPPVKKKYSKEHLLVLTFIYYFKSLMSIGDIEKLLTPITEKYFHSEGDLNITHIYDEVCAFDKGRTNILQDDIKSAFEASKESFSDAAEEDKDLLQFFSFICILSLDVYVKKLLIEKLIDTVAEDSSEENQKEKAKKKK